MTGANLTVTCLGCRKSKVYCDTCRRGGICRCNPCACSFGCPSCGARIRGHGSRTCPPCGYTGDWIQPGHVHLYGCPEHREDGHEERERGLARFSRYCLCELLARNGGLRERP